MAKRVSEYDQFQVRLPEGMRDRLRDAAAANNRSMNAEIVDRLEQPFSRLPRVVLPDELNQRFLDASEQKQYVFEVNLSAFATQLADQHFPKVGERQSLIEDVWSEIITDMDNILEPEKKRLKEDMKIVVRELIRRKVIEP